MADNADRTTPGPLFWIVGIAALLWTGFGCYDYVVVQIGNLDYRSPPWLTVLWALTVWGGLLGATLLLLRKRQAVWAFGLSLAAGTVWIGYLMANMKAPPSIKAMMISGFLIASFFLWYSWSAKKRGILK